MDVMDVFKEVIKNTGKKYFLYNDHDVLFLPLYVPVGMSMLLFMKDFFEKYISLIKDSSENLKKLGVDVDSLINNVHKFRNAYVQMHEAILSGDSDDAYHEMTKVLEIDDYFIQTELKSQNPPNRFYRARSGINWTQKEDFYHIPFNKTYLCKSYRFSIAGYPSLYIGYSKEVCKKEVREKECSCIELTQRENLHVVDLTWACKDAKLGLTTFLQAYPLIAACYIVPFFCKHLGKECPDVIEKQTFKEQYIFPQFVTMFIKKHFGVDGIVYYTTRDENLNPLKDIDKNIALFPRYADNILYDQELIDKFTWDNVTTL